MRWPLFLVVLLVVLVFETALAGAASIMGVRPSLCAVLATFIALSAPRMTVLWSCYLIGLMLDLSNRLPLGAAQSLYVIGPYAIGYTIAGYLLLQMRSTVFRQRSLTIGALTVVSLIVVHVVVVTLFVVRGWYPSPAGPLMWAEVGTTNELLRRALAALYSGLVAVPVGWLLVRSMPAWAFQTTTNRSAAWR